MRLKISRRLTKVLLGGTGLVLFVYLILKIGVGTVVENISRFGFWFPVILVIGGIWLFLQACAWYLIQNAFFKKVSFGKIFRVKIIADALNILLPSASLGGDAARAYFIKHKVPLKEGIPAVVFDKTVEFAGSTIFLAVGLVMGACCVKLPEGMLMPTVICLAAAAIGIVLLVILSIRGFYGIFLKATARLPKLRQWVVNRESQLKTLDENLHRLYKSGNCKTLLALLCHFLARVVGVFEVLIILRVLGVPANFMLAAFITSIVIIFNTIFFILPGQWGISESASMLILKGLGYTSAIGLSLSIIRRIRKLVFVGLAFIFYLTEKKSLP